MHGGSKKFSMVADGIENKLTMRASSILRGMDRVKTALTYCALIYGSSPAQSLIANTLALARSLQNSAFGILLLATSDVPASVIRILRDTALFSEIRVVPYLLADEALFKKDWFREVFTKLHIFNLTDFSKVLFLDLDVIVVNVPAMDALLESDILFGAMENSKGSRAASMWLKHGELMQGSCKLINAGVMLVTPDQELFRLMLDDFTHPSPGHVPGMTPEQFYLARVFGKHMSHIEQRYNFEVQLHGGVPVTKLWRSAEFHDIVCFHFSGGNPLERIQDTHDDWGCQVEKRSARERWESELTPAERAGANERAKKAFAQWAFCFSSACRRVKQLVKEIPPELAFLIESGACNANSPFPGYDCVFDDSKGSRVFVHPVSFDLLNRPADPPRPARRPPPSLS